MNFTKVNEENIYWVKLFLEAAGSSLKTFTYFDKRPVETVYKHKVCYVLIDNYAVVGYGHIEEECGKNWLGICIVESKRGKGYGKEMMKKLIGFCKEKEINPISLSVRKENAVAKKLYEKLGFATYKENESSYFMELKYA